MERYALPHDDYYEWCGPNAGGYVLDAADWADKRVLHLVKTVQYTKRGGRRMMTGLAVLGGFVLDTLFGDPAWLPHPVVFMGKAISALEKRLRARLPKTPQGELLGGGGRWRSACRWGRCCCTGLVCLGRGKAPARGWGWPCRCSGAGRRWPQRAWCRRARTSTRSLIKGDLPAARKAVSRIVGRDTRSADR